MRLKNNFYLLGLLICLSVLAHSVNAEDFKFTKTLYRGIRGDDVRILQEFLKQFPNVYPEGLVTGYFGPLTEKAVKKFQGDYGIEQVGIVGPKTRAKLNELATVLAEKEKEAEIEQPLIPATTTPAEATTTPSIPVPVPIEITPTPIVPALLVPSQYPNIREALNAAKPGDIISVASGAYQENIEININNLILKSEKGADVTIINPQRGQALYLAPGVTDILVDGFTIIGLPDYPAVYFDIPSGAASATVQNSIIKSGSIGISAVAKKGTVNIKRNLIISNTNFGIIDNVTDFGSALIENNTIANNETGYYLSADGGGRVVRNNIVASNTKYGFQTSYRSPAKLISASYNDVWGSGKENYYDGNIQTWFTPAGAGNFSADPKFVSGSDYHLKSGSPVINAGDPGSPSDPDGTRADMGAYPYDFSARQTSAMVLNSIFKFFQNILRFLGL